MIATKGWVKGRRGGWWWWRHLTGVCLSKQGHGGGHRSRGKAVSEEEVASSLLSWAISELPPLPGGLETFRVGFRGLGGLKGRRHGEGSGGSKEEGRARGPSGAGGFSSTLVWENELSQGTIPLPWDFWSLSWY